nr:hypothetical protein [uncultured Allomuricauda sp.]
MKSFLTSAAMLLAVLLFSCDTNDDADTGCVDAICTLEFVTILVTLEDSNQNPVVLDNFEVINAANGSRLGTSFSDSELEEARQLGRYPLVSDGVLGLNQERTLIFSGFIGSREMVQSQYTVATDCCHVSLVDGELQLVVD